MRRLALLAVIAGCCGAMAAEDKTAPPPSAKSKPAISVDPSSFGGFADEPPTTAKNKPRVKSVPHDGPNPFPDYDPFPVVKALTPAQVFAKVKNSVVVIKTLDANGKIIGLGSGVMLHSGKIGTNCHVMKGGARFLAGSGKQFVPAVLWGGDENKDICLVEARGLTAKPARQALATSLKVGDPVYAVGAPQGLELSLSNGIVSQLRGGPPPLIQTTAAISPGSSGGGLFDAGGRLVGFTTLYIEGGQNLNFAMPVEWVEEMQQGMKVAQGRSEMDWNKRASALESARNWMELREWCQQWTQARPEASSAWFGLGAANYTLQRHTEAIEALRQGLRIDPDSGPAWALLGMNYSKLNRYAEAIDAERKAVRINPEIVLAWDELGNAYSELERYAEAIEAQRQAVRIEPRNALRWGFLGNSYRKLNRHTEAIDTYLQAVRISPEHEWLWWGLADAYRSLQNHSEAIDAYRQVVRINPQNAEAWSLLAIEYALSGNRTAALEAVQQLRRLDPADADKLFKLIVPR